MKTKIINVISKKPSTTDSYSKADVTLGTFNLNKIRATTNLAVSDNLATKFSVSITERDGFSKNVITGQDLDDASNISIRSDWIYELSDTSSVRIFGQYFDIDRNGAAMRGIDDRTSSSDIRKLSQDSLSKQELSSKVFAVIYESDLGFASLKVMGSIQEDDILVARDNDRHNFGDQVLAIPGLGAGATYQRAEFRPETSLVDTTTFEINLISNEPALDGKLDWTVGAFYMDHEIENHIRGYRDNDLDGELRYVCGEPFAISSYCYTHDYGIPGRFDVYAAEFDFVTDAYPSRESYSVYGQTTYSVSDDFRFVSGVRYSEDTFATDVTNFFNVDPFQAKGTSDEVTTRFTGELDLGDATMTYLSFSKGFKPGGSNLTYGFADDNAPPMVFQTFEPETVDSVELGLKTDLFDGKGRANIAVFSYDYENLQFQATDPDPYRGGVANIPESEMSGLEIEFTGLVSDTLTFDMNLAFLDSEVTSDYDVLDNVDAYQYFFGEEDLRYALRENVKGNKLAKSPEFTADISLIYESELSSGNPISAIGQFVYRGDFEQRVSNNSIVDSIPSYQIFNLTIGIDFKNDIGLDIILLNAGDKDGINSSMTDVFGVAATGLEFIPPRQLMTRISYNF